MAPGNGRSSTTVSGFSRRISFTINATSALARRPIFKKLKMIQEVSGEWVMMTYAAVNLLLGAVADARKRASRQSQR